MYTYHEIWRRANILIPNDKVKINLGFVDWPKNETLSLSLSLNLTKPDGSLLHKEDFSFGTNTQGPIVFSKELNLPGKIDYGGTSQIRLGIFKEGKAIDILDSHIQSDGTGRYIVASCLIPHITQQDGVSIYLKAINNTLQYILPDSGTLSINICDLWGKEIKRLNSSYKTSGLYSISWDGKNENGNIVPDGAYFFVVKQNLDNGYLSTNKACVLINNNTLPSPILKLNVTGEEVSQSEDKIILTWDSEINSLLFSYGIIPEGYNIYYQGSLTDRITQEDIAKCIAKTSTHPKFSLSSDFKTAMYEEKRKSMKSHSYGVSKFNNLSEGSIEHKVVKPKDIYPPSISLLNVDIQQNKVIVSFEGEDNLGKEDLQYSYSLNNGVWSEYRYRRYVIYENLLNGNYTFSVKAKDEGGNASSIASKEFFITPPAKQLTTDLGPDGCPCFSPDGKKIVYTSYTGGNANLWVMDIDGKNKNKILRGYGPNFSPDGKYLAFSDGKDIFVITNIQDVINKDALPSLVQITEGPDDNDHWPYFSPDGKWLAYGSTKNGNRDIYVITNIADVINKQATPQTKRITTDPSYENGPCFSPDGKKIVFISDKTGNNHDWAIVNIDSVIKNNASPTILQVTNYLGDEMGRFSPDGRMFAFSSMMGGNAYDGWIIKNIEDVFNGLSANIVPLTSWPGHDGPDDWSPDGTKLLIGSNKEGNWDIYIIDYLSNSSAFPSANITYPILNQEVSGKVEIKGQAMDNISVDGTNLLSKLLSYTLEYGRGESPSNWNVITTSNIPVDNGIIATWDVAGLANGTYTIRLTATDGNDTNIKKIIVIVKNQWGFFDNFDDGIPDGWQATGLWHLEKKRCNSSPYSFAYNNGTNYNTGRRNSGYIISPEIDLSSVKSAKLSFWTFWEHESYPWGYYDNMKVEIFDGSSWNQIFYNDCKGLSYSDWHQEVFDISSYCGKKIKIRFSFDTVDGLYNNYEGWYIDDVRVEIPEPTIFTENFDDGDTQEWNLSGLWRISNKRSDTPQYSIAYNNGTNYNVGRTYGEAISPIIDLTKENDALLSFKSWYETEYTGTYWDRKIVYIATEDTNYTNWTQIAQVSGTMRNWQAYTANLTPYCKKKIKIKFFFNSIDSLYNNYEGWYVDSIEIKRGSTKGISFIMNQSLLSHISSILDKRTSSFLEQVDSLPPFNSIMAEIVSYKIDKIDAKREKKEKYAFLSFNQGSKYAKEESLFEGEIWVNTQGLLGGEITITFNPAKIEIKEVKEGNIFSNPKGFYLLNNKEGYLKVQILGEESKNKGSLFKIKCFVKAFPATIKIESADLRDSLNHKLETRIENITIESIGQTELLQSFPNPSKDGAWIPFKLAQDADVSLTIYNILGQKMRTIDIGQRKAGSYTKAKEDSAIFWDQKNDKGQPVSSGLYFYELKTGDFRKIKSLVVK